MIEFWKEINRTEKTIIILILLAIISSSIYAGTLIRKLNESIHTNKQLKYSNLDVDTSDLQTLQRLLDQHELKFQRILIAQAKLETGNFTSKGFKENKNYFGMKVAAQRLCFAINDYDYGNYAKYDNLEHSVVDMLSWQKSNACLLTTEDQYFELLKKLYSSNPNYIKKLKEML